jgi:hypothetical protein
MIPRLSHLTDSQIKDWEIIKHWQSEPITIRRVKQLIWEEELSYEEIASHLHATSSQGFGSSEAYHFIDWCQDQDWTLPEFPGHYWAEVIKDRELVQLVVECKKIPNMPGWTGPFLGKDTVYVHRWGPEVKDWK